MRPDPKELYSFGPASIYLTVMSDWSLTEIEDINWDVFGKSDDHMVVPHGGGELLDESSVHSHSHKKPRHELRSDVGKNKSNKYYAAKTVIHGKEDAYYTPMQDGSLPNTIVLSLSDLERRANGKITNNCVSVSNTDPKSNMCFESVQKNKATDMAHFDWPDLSNFEDIDKMFGNWDSIFGQEHIATADELSSFSSSSNAIYGSEIAFEPGNQSSGPNLVASQDTSESHFPNSDVLHQNAPSISNHRNSVSSSFGPWVRTNDTSYVKSACKEKSCDGGDINNTGVSQMKNEYMIQSGPHAIKLENQQSSKINRMDQSNDQILLDSEVSASQLFSSENTSQQKQFIGSSNYMPNLNSHSELVYGIPIHQVPFSVASNVEGDGFNPFLSHKVSDDIVNQLYRPQAMASEEIREKIERLYPKPSLQSNASVKKNLLEVRNNSRMEDADNTEKVTSFWHLQDAMHQLDVTTKVCIRDSLYRLARSAKQRHDFNPQNCSESKIDSKGVQGIEESKRAAEFMDAETKSWPIDRSIAQLLFQRRLESSIKIPDCTTSFESHIMV